MQFAENSSSYQTNDKRSSILKHFTIVTRALFLNFIKKIYITVTLSLEKKCINFICFSLPQRAATTFNIPTYEYPIHLSILQNTIQKGEYTACAFVKREFALSKKKKGEGERNSNPPLTPVPQQLSSTLLMEFLKFMIF